MYKIMLFYNIMKKQTDNKFIRQTFDRPHIPSTINELNEYSIIKLFTLTKEGDIHKIKEFISNNNINYLSARDNNGRNVIHSVIENMLITDEKQKCDIIDFFILNGVSVNVQDNNNITPLHLACKYQLYSVIELLLKNNANPNLVDNQHMSCLHYACQGNIVKCDEVPKADMLSKDEYSDLVENIVHLLYNSSVPPSGPIAPIAPPSGFVAPIVPPAGVPVAPIALPSGFVAPISPPAGVPVVGLVAPISPPAGVPVVSPVAPISPPASVPVAGPVAPPAGVPVAGPVAPIALPAGVPVAPPAAFPASLTSASASVPTPTSAPVFSSVTSTPTTNTTTSLTTTTIATTTSPTLGLTVISDPTFPKLNVATLKPALPKSVSTLVDDKKNINISGWIQYGDNPDYYVNKHHSLMFIKSKNYFKTKAGFRFRPIYKKFDPFGSFNEKDNLKNKEDK